ncbi:MAG: hypothetical protein CVU66_00745 [Deltaproteobacteria bacterium HGW-Deltaproteobacteria-23]|nr:MAG: hypothetical protein CVU66_00745 [Deltaproteobacteria bacterium HGW-Deltaproteobacteria-23]
MSIVEVDLFRTIVERTSAKVQHDYAATGLKCFYQHGHPLEIVESLQEMTLNPKSSETKYPLIALFQDFTEKKGLNNSDGELKLNLIIANLTSPQLKAPDRYAQNFKPILIPIYDEFLKQIAKSRYFREDNPIKLLHTKIDRLYWGRSGLFGNQKNLFNDYIDCIEIVDLQLNLKQNTFC